MTFKKKFTVFFDVFKYAMLVLGTIIGGGLASGKEVVSFFAQYGFISLILLPLLFVLLCYGLIVFMNFGNIKHSIDFKDNKILTLFDIFSFVILVIIGASMLAGLNELLSDVVLDFGFPVWSMIFMAISTLVVALGLRIITNLSVYLVPFIIISIIVICFKVESVSTLSPPVFSSDFINIALLSVGVIGYGLCNLVMSNKLLFKIGNRLTKSQVFWVSVIVSLTLVVLLMVIICAILMTDSAILFSDLPLVYISFLISKQVGMFFAFVILLSILTTLFSTQFSFHDILKQKTKGRFYPFIISSALFLGVSFIGFGDIVKYCYPIAGAVGFLMILFIRKLSPKMCFDATYHEVHTTRKNT